jgi:hypothetical protein
MFTKDQLAMQVLRAAEQEGMQIRLSNKSANGYWWCYMGDHVEQADDPAIAILNLVRYIPENRDTSWDDVCETVRQFLQGWSRQHTPGNVDCNGH